jgi:hypothetical protein
VNIQQDNHWRWLRRLEDNLETNLDLHAVLSTLPVFEATTQRPFRLAQTLSNIARTACIKIV